jgi:hypothetical protein
MSDGDSRCRKSHRRAFLSDAARIALASMLCRDGFAAGEPGVSTPGYRPPDGKPHFAPKAKSVIWLFMIGGVSHM